MMHDVGAKKLLGISKTLTKNPTRQTPKPLSGQAGSRADATAQAAALCKAAASGRAADATLGVGSS